MSNVSAEERLRIVQRVGVGVFFLEDVDEETVEAIDDGGRAEVAQMSGEDVPVPNGPVVGGRRDCAVQTVDGRV